MLLLARHSPDSLQLIVQGEAAGSASSEQADEEWSEWRTVKRTFGIGFPFDMKSNGLLPQLVYSRSRRNLCFRGGIYANSLR